MPVVFNHLIELGIIELQENFSAENNRILVIIATEHFSRMFWLDVL